MSASKATDLSVPWICRICRTPGIEYRASETITCSPSACRAPRVLLTSNQHIATASSQCESPPTESALHFCDRRFFHCTEQTYCRLFVLLMLSENESSRRSSRWQLQLWWFQQQRVVRRVRHSVSDDLP